MDVFEASPGLRIESVLVSPDSDGTYFYRGTCYEPDGETSYSSVIVDLPATQVTDPGVGDFFVEEELSVVEIHGLLFEYDQERKIYSYSVGSREWYSVKAVERNGDHYLLQKYGLQKDDSSDDVYDVYCLYAVE